jgi:hypothetical protein
MNGDIAPTPVAAADSLRDVISAQLNRFRARPLVDQPLDILIHPDDVAALLVAQPGLNTPEGPLTFEGLPLIQDLGATRGTPTVRATIDPGSSGAW